MQPLEEEIILSLMRRVYQFGRFALFSLEQED